MLNDLFFRKIILAAIWRITGSQQSKLSTMMPDAYFGWETLIAQKSFSCKWQNIQLKLAQAEKVNLLACNQEFIWCNQDLISHSVSPGFVSFCVSSLIGRFLPCGFRFLMEKWAFLVVQATVWWLVSIGPDCLGLVHLPTPEPVIASE